MARPFNNYISTIKTVALFLFAFSSSIVIGLFSIVVVIEEFKRRYSKAKVLLLSSIINTIFSVLSTLPFTVLIVFETYKHCTNPLDRVFFVALEIPLQINACISNFVKYLTLWFFISLIYIETKDFLGICLASALVQTFIMCYVTVPIEPIALIFPVTTVVAIIFIVWRYSPKLLDKIREYRSQADKVSIWDY